MSFTWLGPSEAQIMLIGRYCIVTGLGLKKDRLGGQVAWAWLGFSKTWLYQDFGPPPIPFQILLIFLNILLDLSLSVNVSF